MTHPHLWWSDETIAKKMTKRRLSCLRSISRFGIVSVELQYGRNRYWKIYTVHSLTELVDSTSVVLWLRKMGLIQRTYPGSMDYKLSSRGVQLLCYVSGLPYHVNCRCSAK